MQMEKVTVVVVGLLAGLGVTAEVHEFSTPDGKTVKAEIWATMPNSDRWS